MSCRISLKTLSIALCLAACGSPASPATTPEPLSCPPTESVECPVEAPVVVEAPPADEEEPTERQVIAGECDLDAIPAAMLEETTPEQNEAIITAVREWVNGESAPWVVAREGILFAKSEDDLGGDPPHPTWTQEQGERACGVQTLWLRDRLLAQLRLHAHPEYGSPIQCTGNVCCYSALGEYDSGGGVVLSSQGDGWRLRAGYEVAINGTIGGEHAGEMSEQVKRRLQRLLRGRCAGEPTVMP